MTGPDDARPNAIADPWHSRPLDVHRWSDHPNAFLLAERVWDAHFADYREQDHKPGPKPKTSYRNQLKVVVLDLYVAWLVDPTLSIGVPMSSNGWDSNSRYNALHLTRKITSLVTRLHDVGLIDLAAGSYGGRLSLTNRITRIRAAAPLVALFADIKLRQTDIRQFPGQECIILKNNEDDDGPGREVEYEETPQTYEMREELMEYNSLLSRSFIDLPDEEHDYVVRPNTGGPDDFREVRVSTAASRVFVRRIFSRGSWEKNGRFYGGWWQQISQDHRKRIHIDDQPTVEVDFKGMHVSILSLERRVTLEGDPYALPPGVVAGVPASLQRALVKQLVLTTINARTKRSAFGSFRDGWATGHFGKEMTNVELQRLLDAFTDRHPHLKPSLCSDQGIRLMYVDSCIAAHVLRHFTQRQIPVLCVHDSFIVPYECVLELKAVMARASEAVVGHPLAVDGTYVGLDEKRATDPEFVELYIEHRHIDRTDGYLGRLAGHKVRTG